MVGQTPTLLPSSFRAEILLYLSPPLGLVWREKVHMLPAKAGATSVHSFTRVYIQSAVIDGAPAMCWHRGE